MAEYGWVGPGKMRSLDHTRAEAPIIAVPVELSEDGPDAQTQLYVCSIDGCGKRYKLAMLIARHFNANHAALRKDKDTWREYYEEVWN